MKGHTICKSTKLFHTEPKTTASRAGLSVCSQLVGCELLTVPEGTDAGLEVGTTVSVWDLARGGRCFVGMGGGLMLDRSDRQGRESVKLQWLCTKLASISQNTLTRAFPHHNLPGGVYFHIPTNSTTRFS